MQNRVEKKDKHVGFIYAASGAMFGAHYWNEFYHIPYFFSKIRYDLIHRQYMNNRSPNNSRFDFHAAMKMKKAQTHMIGGLKIIPITAATFYLIGKSVSFFEKSKRKDELPKVEINQINKRFDR